MQLSVIIVNYRSDDLIVDCLRSFLTPEADVEVIIVNNDDLKRTENRIRALFPSVKWIESGYNAGFARANNLGIKAAKAPIVLLLNPDTIIVDDSLKRCCSRFATEDYAACGVQLLNPDGSPQISGNYAMRGGLNYLLPLPYIGAILKWLGTTLKISKPNVPNAESKVEVDWINGAFLMVKQQAIEKAGMLDEDFFLYAEEAEWCSRLKKAGKLCIYGDLKVVHLQGETANDAFNSSGKGYYNLFDRKGLQIILSNFVRIRKEFGLFWYFLDLLIYTFTVPVFLIIGFFHQLTLLKNPFEHFSRWKGFTRNIISLWCYTPRIISGKPYFYKVL